MLSPLTVAHLFTWALPAGATFILGEGARPVRDLLEAWAAEEGKLPQERQRLHQQHSEETGVSQTAALRELSPGFRACLSLP